MTDLEDDDIAEEIEHDPTFAALKSGAPVPAMDGIWLQKSGLPVKSPVEMPGSTILANAHALLPELERRRSGYEDALIDLRQAGASHFLNTWRLSGRTYLALVALAGVLLTAGAYGSIATLRPGVMSFLATTGFAVNVVGIAHLAGGWGRRVTGLRSWLRRGVTGLLAIGACAQIVALVYLFGLGWTDTAAMPMAIMLAGAMVAVVASALRTHPDPDIGRLLRRRAEALRDYEGVRRQAVAEIRKARQAFEAEVAALLEAARPLTRSRGAAEDGLS